jgi:hypothetical protein
MGINTSIHKQKKNPKQHEKAFFVSLIPSNLKNMALEHYQFYPYRLPRNGSARISQTARYANGPETNLKVEIH